MIGKLYAAFFKIGLFTFGGGYAMLPLMQNELVEKQNWVGEEELLNYFSISQVMPGIIAVNTATFVGDKLRGWPGAIASMLGVISPSIIIITVIAILFSQFAHLEPVAHALAGIRIAVAALMVITIIRMARSGVKGWLAAILCVAAFVFVAFVKVSPVYVVLVGLGAGVAYALWKRRKTC